MTFLEAALTVLHAERRPMTTREIVDAASRRRLLTSRGRTPENTVDARLYLAIRDEPEGELVRIFAPGTTRARRGSVRWAVR